MLGLGVDQSTLSRTVAPLTNRSLFSTCARGKFRSQREADASKFTIFALQGCLNACIRGTQSRVIENTSTREQKEIPLHQRAGGPLQTVHYLRYNYSTEYVCVCVWRGGGAASSSPALSHPSTQSKHTHTHTHTHTLTQTRVPASAAHNRMRPKALKLCQ